MPELTDNAVDQVDVEITYKDNKITCTGPGVEAVLTIEGSELRKLYWGKKGKGTLNVDIG